MKSFIVEVKIFNLNELNETSKQKAIEKHRNFLLSEMQTSDFISGVEEYDTEENLEKEYDAQYDYYLENDEPIIESIEMNDYYYYEDGKMANVVTYCGKHEKAGTSEFKHNGEIYTF